MISHSLACLKNFKDKCDNKMQRLREQFSRRKQNTIDHAGSEPVTPARHSLGQTSISNYGQPRSDPNPTTHSNLFRFPSNSSQQQKSPKKSPAQKDRKRMLRQQAHSLPQSPPVRQNEVKHPPLAYHESQPETSYPHYLKEFKQSSQILSNFPTTSCETFKKPKTHNQAENFMQQKPQIQSLQQQIHYKRNLMTNQMQIRYQQQQLPRHQRVNQSFSSSVQHIIPSSPLLQLADSKYRSASFEEIRSVRENKLIYEEHSIEVEDTNLSLSESNSSSLHYKNFSQQQKNIASCCSSTGSINVNTTCSIFNVNQPSYSTFLQKNQQLQQMRQSNVIKNPTVSTLASTKSPRSKSFDCCQATACQHTLHQQQSLQDKLLIINNNVTTSNTNVNPNVQYSSFSNMSTSLTFSNSREQQQQQQQIGSTVRCNASQPISNIQAISTASISSAASDSPSRKKGPFLEIPKWRMLIRRTTTSNQLSAQHNKNADGSLTLQTEFNLPTSAAIDKQQTVRAFEKECVHCALISELLKLNRISSRGTSTHTSLSSLDSSHDSDSDYNLHKEQQFNSISKSGEYFDLSSSIKELDNLSEHINKLEIDQNEKFSSQFAKCSSGSSGNSGELGCLKLPGAIADSLEDDFFTETQNDETSFSNQHQANQSQTNLQTNTQQQIESNTGDLSKSVSFNEENYCTENYADPTEHHTSTSNSRNASLISLPMVTLSLPSSESDDQITSLASIGQQASTQVYSPPISPPPQSSRHQSICCKNNKTDLNEFEQANNNSSCITVVSLTVPVLVNKSGRSASVDSAYLKVPQRTDIGVGSREAPPARGGQRSKSVDITLPEGPDGSYLHKL